MAFGLIHAGLMLAEVRPVNEPLGAASISWSDAVRDTRNIAEPVEIKGMIQKMIFKNHCKQYVYIYIYIYEW